MFPVVSISIYSYAFATRSYLSAHYAYYFHKFRSFKAMKPVVAIFFKTTTVTATP